MDSVSASRSVARLVSGLVLGIGASCSPDEKRNEDPDGGVSPPPAASAEFTAFPVDIDRIEILTPLGSLAPPGHVLPTDHVYFYQVDFDHPSNEPPTAVLPVFAPATGTLNWTLLQHGGDWKLEFIVTSEFRYYLDHVQPRPGLTIGTVVQAGEQIGTTNPGGTLDLGAYDTRVSLPGLVNPARYPDPSRHCVSPWQYFAPSLRATALARLRRHPDAPDKDGRIDFGVPGRLVGDWFHESLPETPEGSAGLSAWPKTLAFVYDYYDPSKIRVSIGGTIDRPGVWTLPADAPAPASVSVASGEVVYRLMYTESTTAQHGLMVVRMECDESIRVQVFPSDTLSSADFDENAQVYRR